MRWRSGKESEEAFFETCNFTCILLAEQNNFADSTREASTSSSELIGVATIDQSAQRRKESSRTCEKVEYARNNENPHYDLIAMLDDWG